MTKFSFIVLASAAVVASASAQSRSSSGIVGAINTVNGGGITAIAQQDGDGSPVTVTGSKSFTGKNRANATRTMDFSGSLTASAEYGRLRCKTSASIVNSYYNASNPVYANGGGGVTNPNGSPDQLCSLGFATFDDTLQFGGALQAGYKARYVFHVDGFNSGAGYLADLAVDVDGKPGDAFFAFAPGANSANWATKSYDINGTTPQSIHVQFSTQVVLDMQSLTDGASASGLSDFSSTLTLTAIQVVDANDNPVTGVTFTSGSGTAYPVPEPSCLVLLAGLVPVLRRRRRS